MKYFSVDITKAMVYNKSLPSKGKGCMAYVKDNKGKSYKLSFDCSKSKEVAQHWEGGDIMWDQVDLIRSNPNVLAMEDADAEQIYVDGIGGPDAAPADNDDRFLNCQMAQTHEFPAFKGGTPEKNSNKPGKPWKNLDWVKEFPGFAPKTVESKPSGNKMMTKEFLLKQKQQTTDPHKEQGRMPVPALVNPTENTADNTRKVGEPIQNYSLDLNHYGDKDFYQQEYPGLGANAKEITHFLGLYQDDPQTHPLPPSKKLGKKFKYKIGERKTYTNQYKVLIEAPMKLYKDFMVAKK